MTLNKPVPKSGEGHVWGNYSHPKVLTLQIRKQEPAAMFYVSQRCLRRYCTAPEDVLSDGPLSFPAAGRSISEPLTVCTGVLYRVVTKTGVSVFLCVYVYNSVPVYVSVCVSLYVFVCLRVSVSDGLETNFIFCYLSLCVYSANTCQAFGSEN